jgi:hypothetical protein
MGGSNSRCGPLCTKKHRVLLFLAGVTLLGIECSGCGPLGTPMQPLGPAPQTAPPAAESPQEQLDRFNIFLNRA